MQALFEEHRAWAEAIGQSVGRHLPPSFDVADLMQIALIQHWRCCESYDPSRNVPYRAYARRAIRGAVLMCCRRRHYREATHEELKESHPHLDSRLRPDELLTAREDWRNRLGPQLYRKRVRVLAALEALAAEDASLVRLAFFEGAEVSELEAETPGITKRLSSAVRRLKRLVKNGTHAPTVRPSVNVLELRAPSHRSRDVKGPQPLRPPLRLQAEQSLSG